MPRILLLATMLCAALLTACGASDERADRAEPEPSSEKERFIAAGDKLCAQLAERFPRMRADRDERSPAARLGAASRYREFTRELHSGLVRLGAPSDAQAQQIVSTSQRLASAAREQKIIQKRVVALTDADDLDAAFQAALRSVRAQQRMMRELAVPLDARLRAYGFEVCGRPQTSGAKPAARTRS